MMQNPLRRQRRDTPEEAFAAALKEVAAELKKVNEHLDELCGAMYGGTDKNRQYHPGLLDRFAKMEEEVEAVKEANRREDQNQEWIMGRLARVLGEETPSRRGGGEADGPTIPVR